MGDALHLPRVLQLARSSREPLVLGYHGVEPKPLSWNRLAISEERFAAQMAYVSRNFEAVSLSELLQSSPAVASRRVAVTFDDGLRNNLVCALPVLRAYNIPATFFVATYHCEPPHLLWFNTVKLGLMYADSESLVVGGRSFRLGTVRQRQEAKTTLLDASTRMSPRELQDLADAVPDPWSVAPRDVIDDGFRGLSAEEVRTLAADPLVEIGAHTHYHSFLPACDDAEARADIESGVRALHAMTGSRPRYFAYPSGELDERIVTLTKDAGFSAAFAVTGRAPVKMGEFAIPRTGIYEGSVTSLAVKSWR